MLCTFWLANVLRATTACTLSSLIWPAGSAPAALASLLFDPLEPQIIGKTQFFATFLPFRASASSFFWLFLFSDLLSSNLSLLSASALLGFSSVHIVGSLTSKLPSIINYLVNTPTTYIYTYRDIDLYPSSVYRSMIFPECVARVPVSLWGLGVEGVFARRCVRVRNRPQPSATVRNRSQPSATVRAIPVWPCLWEVLQRWSFWGFQTCRCFVSRGRRGTSWHSDVFCNVLKIVLRGRRNTFVTFSEDVLQFSWQAQHFGRVHRHFSWQAQHFRRVLLRVFCKSHWQGCVKWWKLTEASHETSMLRLPIFRF